MWQPVDNYQKLVQPRQGFFRTFSSCFITQRLANSQRQINVKGGTEARGRRETTRWDAIEGWDTSLPQETVTMHEKVELQRVPRTPFGPNRS
jgi:hypothetical protein